MGTDLGGEQSGEARLAGTRWAPQKQRREMAPGHAARERPALTDEMLLADELRKVSRPHPGRERLLLGRWLEEWLRSGAARLRPCRWHAASLEAVDHSAALVHRQSPQLAFVTFHDR
jgi:hypothetical protein